MDEKRMVGDYTVINSMYIGHREIILGENPKAASGERYVCCYAERVLFYEQYLEAQVSDDFAEIVKLYGERVTQAADEIMKETEKVASEIGMNDEITAKDCKPISHDDAIEDKVIVIRGNVLRPEFRHASHQLMLCTGGFGAQKNARGRTCYCIALYSGKQTSFYRSDVLGVMDTRSLTKAKKHIGNIVRKSESKRMRSGSTAMKSASAGRNRPEPRRLLLRNLIHMNRLHEPQSRKVLRRRGESQHQNGKLTLKSKTLFNRGRMSTSRTPSEKQHPQVVKSGRMLYV
jgi:hypothetical protein